MSALFAILSSLIRVHTISHSQQSDQGLYCLPFSAFWSGSNLFAIHSNLFTDYTVCHSQQFNQGLCYLPFSIWSESTPYVILSILIKVNTVILSSLVKVKVHCHSHEKFDQGLRCLPFSAVWSGSALFAILSLIRVYTTCHSQQFDQGQGPQSFSGTVWSRSTLFAILCSLISLYTVCHSQETDQSLHYLPFAEVWSRTTLFAILSHLIRVCTIWHSQQSDQGLHYLQFVLIKKISNDQELIQSDPTSAVILRLHCLPFSAVWSGSIVFAILSSLIRLYTVCHSQQSDKGLHNFPFPV